MYIPFEYGNEEDDSLALSEISVDKKSLKTFYAQFPSDTLEAFNKISKFARE
jgi:hypothetical protein